MTPLKATKDLQVDVVSVNMLEIFHIIPNRICTRYPWEKEEWKYGLLHSKTD
jgi:hypothetical protein